MTTDKTLQQAQQTPAPQKRPTLKDIAYMTGLGVTTVSRALNDAPDIGESTKERVRLVAKQIGYRPNRAGVRLRTGKTNVISLVVSTEAGAMGMTAPFVAGISEYLSKTNYHLVVTPYHHSQDPMDPIRYIVETGAADGVIISRMMPNDARVKYLVERGFPFATHGRTEMDVDHAYFDFDNESYARLAVRKLAECGREKIGLTSPPDYLTFAHHLMMGFTSAIEENGLLEIPIRNVSIDSPFETMQQELERILKSRHPFDGIVCASANAALAAVAAIEAVGLKVGKDVDIVAKESFDLLNHIRPELITVREDFYDAGQQLIDMVLRQINGESVAHLKKLQMPSEIPGHHEVVDVK